MDVGEWRGQDVEVFEGPLNVTAADINLKRVYYDRSGNKVKLYIGYFTRQSRDKGIVTSRYNWLHNNARIVRLPLDSYHEIIIKETKYDFKTAYFWYMVNGRELVSRYRVRLATLLDAFTKRKTNAAIVVVVTDYIQVPKKEPENYANKFIKSSFRVIQNYLNTT